MAHPPRTAGSGSELGLGLEDWLGVGRGKDHLGEVALAIGDVGPDDVRKVSRTVGSANISAVGEILADVLANLVEKILLGGLVVGALAVDLELTQPDAEAAAFPSRDLGVEVVIAKQDLDLWSADEEGELTAAALNRQWQVVVQDRVEPRAHLLAKRGNRQRGAHEKSVHDVRNVRKVPAWASR
jgi:hypothetical protein